MNPDIRTPSSKLARFFDTLPTALVAFGFFLLGGLVIAAIAKSSEPPPVKKSVEWNYNRTIGQAWLATLNDSPNGTMPAWATTDVYAVAQYLARAGLNDPKIWFMHTDRAKGVFDGEIQRIVNPEDRRQIDPKFKGAALSYAVALFPTDIGSITAMSADTPLIWTRGLQPDGTWRKDSPFGGDFGYICFLGGNLERYDGSINGRLVKWGTKEPTSNILEALPAGTRIGEYTPTPEDLVRGQEFVRREKMQKEWDAVMKQLLVALSWSVSLLLTLAASYFFAVSPPKSPERLMCALGAVACATWFWLMALSSAASY